MSVPCNKALSRCGSTNSKTKYQVSITAIPNNGGSVSPSSGQYKEGTELHLEATPTDNTWKFDHWSGDYMGTSSMGTVTVTKALNIKAHFLKKQYKLTVNTDGKGEVVQKIVTSNARTAKDYDAGTTVQLTAKPEQGWKFVKWKGDLSGSKNPAVITVKEPKKVTAVFIKKDYKLTVNTKGKGTVEQKIIESKVSTAKNYTYGTLVQLTSKPAEGWKFVKWTGDLTGSKNPAQITIKNPKEVTAVFKQQKFILSVKTKGKGNITINPDQPKYRYGTKVALTASASGDWAFNKWKGDINGNQKTITITMGSDKSIIALFRNTLFAGGYGTKDEPYKISTVKQLQAIRQYPNAHYIQINDIDASATKNLNSGKGFKPIGGRIIPFKGSFDGQEYRISNLHINRSGKDIGLFAYAKEAIFKDINIINIDIQTTNADFVGGLISSCIKCKLININITGFLSGGNTFTGGIFGLITNDNSPQYILNDLTSYVVVESPGTGSAGGVGGKYRTGIIKNSKSLGNVRGGGSTGGLIGIARKTVIKNCFATGKVNGNKSISGGLIGLFTGNITDSYATGDVIGGNYTGGLVGKMSNKHWVVGNMELYIKNSYSTGDVKGSKYVGGIVGKGYGNNKIEIINSYSEGNITGKEFIGGIAGYLDDVKVLNSYSKGNVIGKRAVGGLMGYMEGGSVVNSKSIGKIIGDERVGGLVGSASFTSITNSHSIGVTKGKNVIGGLVGFSATTDIVKSYTKGSVNGSENKVGGLIGHTVAELSEQTYIKGSYSTASVSGAQVVGGLVGSNSNVIIKNSYAHGNVKGSISVGGLVGINRNEGAIVKSYATGIVTGNSEIGGLVGTNGGTIDSSYWDIESSNQSEGVGRGNSDGAKGLKTSQMRGSAAKKNMKGLDFNKVWKVVTNDYPIFRWQDK